MAEVPGKHWSQEAAFGTRNAYYLIVNQDFIIKTHSAEFHRAISTDDKNLKDRSVFEVFPMLKDFEDELLQLVDKPGKVIVFPNHSQHTSNNPITEFELQVTSVADICAPFLFTFIENSSNHQTRKRSQAIDGVVNQLIKTTRLKDAASIAVEGVMTVLNADCATIMLFDNYGQPQLETHRNFPQNCERFLEGYSPWPVTQTDAGPLLVQVCDDCGLPEPVVREFQYADIKSCVFLPLIGRSRLLGCIVACHQHRVRVLAEEIQAIKAISDIVASTLRRLRNRRALEKSRTLAFKQFAELHRLYETTPIGLCLFDVSLRFLRVNEQLAKMTGKTISALIGKTLSQVAPQIALQMEPVCRKVIATGKEALNLEVHGVTSAAPLAPKDWLISCCPVKSQDDSIYGVSTVVQDITARKTLEQELVKSKRLAERATEAKSRFLAFISHEIRTSLNSVVGMANLLQTTNPTTEQREYLEALTLSSNNLLELINDILDFSKIEAGVIEFKRERFSPGNAIRNISKALQFKTQEKGIRLLTSLDTPLPDYVIGDPLRLNQILTNLINNAIKFTETGHITVECRVIEKQTRRVRLEFSVSDTGIGMPVDKIDAAFESYTQMKNLESNLRLGTGLGLAIVKNLVEQQGGTISAKSKPGVGSTFVVQLEFEQADQAAIAIGDRQEASNSQHELKGCRVLLVEDDKLSQKVVCTMLRKWEIVVDVAENGKIAIAKLKTGSYHAVLMDIRIPEMDGYETTEYIREQMKGEVRQIPIIAMTAAASTQLRESVLTHGMNDFLSKPFRSSELRAKLLQWFCSRE